MSKFIVDLDIDSSKSFLEMILENELDTKVSVSTLDSFDEDKLREALHNFIENACEWINKQSMSFYMQDMGNHTVHFNKELFIQDFCKAMERNKL